MNGQTVLNFKDIERLDRQGVGFNYVNGLPQIYSHVLFEYTYTDHQDKTLLSRWKEEFGKNGVTDDNWQRSTIVIGGVAKNRKVITPQDLDKLNEQNFPMKIFLKVVTRDAFRQDFLGCLHEGKFWAVEYNLNLLGGFGVAEPEKGPCELRMDYIYFTPHTARLLDVQHPLTADRRAKVFGAPWDVLPNSWHPSDHLPVIASFELL